MSFWPNIENSRSRIVFVFIKKNQVDISSLIPEMIKCFDQSEILFQYF
jgi:hypothetical protein